MTDSPVLLIDDAITDLALAEEALETNRLRELLTLIDGTLQWTDGRVTEMETTTFLNTLLREYQRTNLTLLNLYLDAAIRAHELAMLDQPKFVDLINYQGDTQ